MSFYRQQLEDYLSELEVDAYRVLDIGGDQGSVKDRVKSWRVEQYAILDLPKWDLEDDWSEARLTKHSIFENVDVIFCLEVFEYLLKPVVALKNISKLLTIGGEAYVTFQFIYPHHNELDMDSMRITESGIIRLAKIAGLKIDSIHYRRDKSGLLEQFYLADGMRMSKQYDNHNVTGFIVRFSK